VAIGRVLGLSRWQVLRVAKAEGLELQHGGREAVPLIVRGALIEAARRDGATAAARAFGVSRVTTWRLCLPHHALDTLSTS
jgi:ABC-type arginine/histidine transport system permease subunit